MTSSIRTFRPHDWQTGTVGNHREVHQPFDPSGTLRNKRIGKQTSLSDGVAGSSKSLLPGSSSAKPRDKFDNLGLDPKASFVVPPYQLDHELRSSYKADVALGLEDNSGSTSSATQETDISKMVAAMLNAVSDPKTTALDIRNGLSRFGSAVAIEFARALTSSKQYNISDKSARTYWGRLSPVTRALYSLNASVLNKTDTNFLKTLFATAPKSYYDDSYFLQYMAGALANQLHPVGSADLLHNIDRQRFYDILSHKDIIPMVSALLLPEATPEQLRATVEAAAPESAGTFARILGANDDFLLQASKSFDANNTTGITRASPTESPIARVLDALTAGPMTDARNSFVQNMFLATTASDLREPAVQSAMANALAAGWNPTDATKAASDAERLRGILATEQGRQMLGSNADKGPTQTTRENALGVIRLTPTINAQVVSQTKYVWTNPTIFMPLAQNYAKTYYDNRGDKALPLSLTDIENTVGCALGFDVDIPNDINCSEAQADLAQGKFNCYAKSEGAPQIKLVADKIREVAGGEPANVAVVPILFAGENLGAQQVAIFRVIDKSGKERYVDQIGRNYDSFNDWRQDNLLPPGQQVYPKDGHLTLDAYGKIILETSNTPKTIDTLKEKALHYIDRGLGIAGIAASGLAMFVSGGSAAMLSLVGAIAGAWSGGRSIATLLDRNDHGQTLSIADRESRDLWVNVAAGFAGLAAFASTARLEKLRLTGQTASNIEKYAHSTVKGANFVIQGTSLITQAVDTAREWPNMTNEERFSEIVKMGFYTVNTLLSVMDMSNMKPGDLFNPILTRTLILRSNTLPVISDSTLPSPAVSVLRDANGVPAGIRANPNAPQVTVELASQVATGNARIAVAASELSQMAPQAGGFPIGSASRATQDEIHEISENFARWLDELENPLITPEQISEIRQQASLEMTYLEELENWIVNASRDSSGSYYTANS